MSIVVGDGCTHWVGQHIHVRGHEIPDGEYIVIDYLHFRNQYNGMFVKLTLIPAASPKEGV